MLARHRQRERHPPTKASVTEQNEYLEWLFSWEREIIAYRDGNKVKGQNDD